MEEEACGAGTPHAWPPTAILLVKACLTHPLTHPACLVVSGAWVIGLHWHLIDV